MSEQRATLLASDRKHRYHFIAIGGIGMSALAQILLARGYKISGCDMKDSAILHRLAAAGAEVTIGHDPEHLQSGDIVICSDAVKADNCELMHAREMGLTIYKRADLLGALTNESHGIAVSGTHGKTTSSGMLATILIEADMEPTCVLGGELPQLQSNACNGGELVLVEACEAYDSFLDLYPEAALITNIEVDHLDHHGTPEHVYDSFRQFLRQVKAFAVINGDDQLLNSMREIPPRAVSFGLQAGNDYRICEVENGANPTFTLQCPGGKAVKISLRVPGLHNISNAAGAAALSLEIGADIAAVQRGLANFPGMHRRFEIIGAKAGITIVDDYAHHPTEVRATLAAARAAFNGRIIAIFQPHLYSRTRDFLADFAQAFIDADYLMVAPIYGARELPVPGISHELLVAQAQQFMPAEKVISLASLHEAVDIIINSYLMRDKMVEPGNVPLSSGDLIITLGAGDVDIVAREIIEKL